VVSRIGEKRFLGGIGRLPTGRVQPAKIERPAVRQNAVVGFPLGVRDAARQVFDPLKPRRGNANGVHLVRLGQSGRVGRRFSGRVGLGRIHVDTGETGMNQHRQREALDQRSDGVRHVGIVIASRREVESGAAESRWPVCVLTQMRMREPASASGRETGDDYLIAATEVADRLAASGR
jgi:hypothetical protein